MTTYPSSEDQEPVTWLSGHPIYAAHFIVLVYVASMLVTTAAMAFGAAGGLAWLTFDSAAVLRGEVWRVLSYGLVNPPSLWFVVDMFMIVWFGRELEKFFGRRTFLTFYACLYLLSPLLFTLIGLWQPMYLAGETGGFALFIAFATLYPGAMMMFNLLAQWVALILVGIYTLIHLSNRNLPGLISLWATTGFAFGFVRHQQGRFSPPRFRFPRRSPQLRVLDGGAANDPRALRSSNRTASEVDALLDKIAQSGLASLTAKERAQLDRSRAEILKKSGPKPPRPDA